jgi:hypothetical protein
MWERLKRRYTRLFFIIGGFLFIVDQIGRIQTVRDLYAAGKNWFASRSDIQLTWPPHTLLGVGVFFVLLGSISFFMPDRKKASSPVPSPEPPTPPNAAQQGVGAAPHVDLIFELPKNHATSPGQLVRDEKIKVVNTSDIIAYDVSIQPKESHLYEAKFETIARLEKGHPANAVMKLRAKSTSVHYSQFEALLSFELETSSDEENFNVRVPMVVQFYDDKKKVLYQTTHEVIYDGFWREAHTHLVQGTAPVQVTPPLPDVAVLVNTGPSANKLLIKHIMRGTEKLMAWEIIRAGLPNCYFVEFAMPDRAPKAYITSNCNQANERWHEWYKEWKQQPGGFGGSFGTGLDGTLPW